jgi:hypothetical protein
VARKSIKALFASPSIGLALNLIFKRWIVFPPISSLRNPASSEREAPGWT